jgi:hypothetical protein
MKGTMNRAKTSFSTEICAGATISVVQYLALLRYSNGFWSIEPQLRMLDVLQAWTL